MNIIFNEKSGPTSIVIPWIAALNDPRIVTEKAGFLFKALLHEDHMELAAEPCLIHGERLCHYNMPLKQNHPATLIGTVSSTGEFTVLFKPDKGGLTDGQKVHCREGLKAFAALLLEQGYTGEGRLCDITKMILPKIGLSPALQTLTELAVS